jgi:hypothetical protein
MWTGRPTGVHDVLGKGAGVAEVQMGACMCGGTRHAASLRLRLTLNGQNARSGWLSAVLVFVTTVCDDRL